LRFPAGVHGIEVAFWQGGATEDAAGSILVSTHGSWAEVRILPSAGPDDSCEREAGDGAVGVRPERRGAAGAGAGATGGRAGGGRARPGRRAGRDGAARGPRRPGAGPAPADAPGPAAPRRG